MTDVEKRRLQLLQEVRKNYSDKNTPPAIHPRYQSVYHSLYGKETENISRTEGNFLLRILLAAFIFAFVFLIDYYDETVVNVDSKTIVTEIQKDLLSK